MQINFNSKNLSLNSRFESQKNLIAFCFIEIKCCNEKSLWIERTFKKRECIQFMPEINDYTKCQCGKDEFSHTNSRMNEITKSSYAVPPVWDPLTNTDLLPTDAYGTIEFRNGKSQYIRLSNDTHPEDVLTFLHTHWRLDNAKMLISIYGDFVNYDLRPELREVCNEGIFNAAKTTGAWVITDGVHLDVVKRLNESLGDTTGQSRHNIVRIGIVAWGVVHRREDLIGRNKSVPYSFSSANNDGTVLNVNHSHYLLVDDGSVGKFGSEIILRKNLERYISQQKIANNSNHGTPVVRLLMGGGSNCIRSVIDCVTNKPPIPVLVIDKSGGTSDLLSFAHENIQSDGGMSQNTRKRLQAMISNLSRLEHSAYENVFEELMLCVKHKKSITIFRLQNGKESLDQALLSVLLRCQKSSLQYQLHLTMAWNRVDVARKHFLACAHLCKEGALDSLMLEALVHDRVEFVQLLIESGLNVKMWLTIKRLEELYNQRFDPTSTLRHLLSEQKTVTHHHHRRHPPPHHHHPFIDYVPSNYRFSLYEIGQVINKLMGGAFQSLYGKRKFRLLHNAAKIKSRKISTASRTSTTSTTSTNDDDYNHLLSDTFKYPYSELMMWAVLLRRHNMARFMWRMGQESMAKCLIAGKLYSGMAREADEDEDDVGASYEIDKHHQEFVALSTELLNHYCKIDSELTKLLLTYELSNWSNQTCLSLAVADRNMNFLAHTCCQVLLTEMWMGGLRTRKYPSIKVIFGILCFPLIFFFNYKSIEELEIMPQTQHQLQQLNLPNAIIDIPSSSGKSSTAVAAAATAALAAVGAAAAGMNSATNQDGPQLFTERLVVIRCKIIHFYAAPITKFWMHAIGHCVFALLFFYMVIQPTPAERRTAAEWYVLAYMCALTGEKFREFVTCDAPKIRQKVFIFFNDFWNIADISSICLFYIGFALRFHFDSTSRVFYSLTVMLCIVKFVEFFVIGPKFGPYITILKKMVSWKKDLLFYILVILVSFGTFRQSLWFPEQDFKWSSVRKIFLKPYFMLYGETYSDEIWPDCVDDVTSEEEFPCVPGRWLVPFIFAVYLAVGIIVLLSLLIAVINGVFMRIYAHSNTVWKFQRYNLIIKYETRPILPAPFILINHAFITFRYLLMCCTKKQTFFDRGLKVFLDEQDLEKLHDFEDGCIQSFHKNRARRTTTNDKQTDNQKALKLGICSEFQNVET
ncbi:hypothetical protein HELRODRAFT_62898 [Helobdella robusta]|uniref:TRPM SLOG domain-containing protein n=1 Tax=Helobdella robusta TaxID=6412 RepID=T1FX70_HELRO|nr:hypothetical protein HELRODRAFT_62898 [Helobdella robusta]ESO12925.1 hypothetical protein HELRODRAFT_62898 [Helobdella robusta]